MWRRSPSRRVFGFVVASASSLTDEEKDRYRAVYCGLCRALADRYGQLSRAVLTYDLTFYVLLANALSEPDEKRGAEPCPTHPVKAVAWARSPWSDYAADLSVALAYHKCLDDIADDHSVTARVSAAALASAYRRAEERIPEACAAIEAAMERIRSIEEGAGSLNPDAAANEFGRLLGTLFGYHQGYWAEAMEAFGFQLGRFVYLMDAAVDFADDEQSGSYNPFVLTSASPETMELVLRDAAARAAETFERLPLEQDLHLLRSVLYEGVWVQFNRIYHQNNEARDIAGLEKH